MDPEFLAELSIEQWTELPIWVEPAYHSMFSVDTSRAASKGLTCRPLTETIFDTWNWLQSYAAENAPVFPASIGLGSEKEFAALEVWSRTHQQ